jgi:hypothetical protein
MKKFILLISFLHFSWIFAQQFMNCGLEGTYTGPSDLPVNWLAIPHTDPVCTANWSGGATPDLTDEFGPTPGSGIWGYPHSGNTFVSGVNSIAGGTTYYDEGIQQTVSGFQIGTTYKISFYQAVVKQGNCLDTAGCWFVYKENTLIDSSNLSISYLNYDDKNLQWEKRSIIFEATTTTHNLKFLPHDDDTSYGISYTNLNGALRMGIDSIWIEEYFCETDMITSVAVNKNSITSNMSDVTYQWVDCDNNYAILPGATNKTFVATSPGNYAVIISNDWCTDTSGCAEIFCSDIFNVSVLNNNYTLTTDFTGDTYQWVTCPAMTHIVGAVNQDYTPTENGQYSVIVNSNGCIDTSTCYTMNGLFVKENSTDVFNIYPNPSSGIFTIHSNQILDDLVIMIYDARGNLVTSIFDFNSTQQQIDLSYLPAGLYIVRLLNSSITRDEKVIIVR